MTDYNVNLSLKCKVRHLQSQVIIRGGIYNRTTVAAQTFLFIFEDNELAQHVIQDYHHDIGSNLDDYRRAVEHVNADKHYDEIKSTGSKPCPDELHELIQDVSELHVIRLKHIDLVDDKGKKYSDYPGNDIARDIVKLHRLIGEGIYAYID